MPGSISANAEIAESAHSRLGSCVRERDPSARHSSDYARLADRLLHKSHVFSALNQLADYKSAHGLTFVIVASITAGAIIPEIFLILFFQRGRPNSRSFRNLLFTVPVWGLDGLLLIFCIEVKRPGSATS